VAGIQNFTTGSLPKSVVIDPLGKYIYVASSGAGTVSIYAIDANTGALTDVGVPVAAGLSPAHMAITPSGAFAYVVNDNAVAGDVAAFAIDTATGVLTPIDADPNTSGIQNFVAGNASRSVTIHPSGKFAYVSNPGSLDVSAFAIDTATGVLTPIDADQGTAGIQNFAAGPAPYSIAFDATGSFAYVVYYGSHSVSAYSVNATTGALASTGMSVATGTYPWTITVDASGGFAYVTSYSSSDVSAYAINSTTGALTPIDADAVTAGIQNFPAGSGPVFIATGGP
jgi:6-phosphogluconolactonase (cycloisomerase 2 family)